MTADDDKTGRVRLGEKVFDLFIPAEEIRRAVMGVAQRINRDYRDKESLLFLGVLNGSFMFAADLMRMIDLACEISFVKFVSYSGTKSTGKISELIGLAADLRGKHVVVVEDIVDTGESIEHIMRTLVGHEPASVEVATMLFKPDAYGKDIPIKYPCIEIPNYFTVGYGLDYDQMGRNLPDIYKIADGE